MPSRSLVCIILLLVAFIPVTRSATQVDSGLPSPEVSFTISSKTSPAVFHVGEIIPLDLSFTSSSPKSYQINMATSGRSGRGAQEQFVLQPEDGWGDPLKDYFSAFAGDIGGGLTTFKTLSEVPIVISIELNEWVRFDSPGRYRLRVITHRVARINRRDPTPFVNDGQTFTSNELELTVIPTTKEWQDETLHRVLEIIDRFPANAQPGPSQPLDSLRTAIKTLRYLGTAEASQEMALRFDDDSRAFDYGFGLVGSPDRDAGTKAMQQELVDPDHPISSHFLSILSVLSVPSGQAPEIMRTLRQSAFERIREQLREAISKKRGPAKSISLLTVLTSGDGAIPKGTAQTLAEAFDDLPVQEREELLEYRWNLVRGPEMLPVLRKYARQYQDFPELRESNAYTSIRLSGFALQRWYELEPEQARSAIIEEILRQKPRFDEQVLGMLPDKSLPDVEQSLVERLASTANYDIAANLASLIERYATKSVLPQMLSIVDANVGRWACSVQTPALAYLLRADSAAARPRIEAALAARGKGYTACNHSLLVEVANLEIDPLLEELALRSLWDSDAQLAANAATFFGKFGSGAAEESLWERFEAWNREWRGREPELKFVFGEPDPNQGQRSLGENLARSLATGQAWLADAAKLQRIVQLGVGLSSGQQVAHNIEAWNNTPYTITCFDPFSEAKHLCRVLQYGDLSVEMLKQKIAQFPKGSKFIWTENMQPKPPDLDDIYGELQRVAAEHALTLRKPN